MNTTSSVTLLHKLVTLQNLYSSFLSNNAQALKEGKPLPEQLSINLFKLIYLINSNSLINKQFDILNISHSFQVMNSAAQLNNSPYVPALSITDIIKIIIEVLGKDSIIIPQQSSSNKDKQLLRLSPQISLDFIKQNLGEIFVAYKKESVLQIENYENDYKTTLKEIELIENGKIDDKLLIEEYTKTVKLKELLQQRQQQVAQLLALSSQQGTPILRSKQSPPTIPQQPNLQTPTTRRQGPAPSTPHTAPPASRRQLSVSTPSLQIIPPSALKSNVPATQVKSSTSQELHLPSLVEIHKPTTRSLDRKLEVAETPVLKQQELLKASQRSLSEEELEKQKILEEIEDSLINSDRELEVELKPKVEASPLRRKSTTKSEEVLAKSNEPLEEIDNNDLSSKSSSVQDEGKPEIKTEKEQDNASSDSEEEKLESSSDEVLKEEEKEEEEDDEKETSTPKKEIEEEEEAPTPEPMTPPRAKTRSKAKSQEEEPKEDEEQEVEGSQGTSEEKDEEEEDGDEDGDEDKPKTRMATKRSLKQQLLPISTRKRKRSETPSAETPIKHHHQPNKKFQTIALQLITQISAHRFASTFLQPVNANDEPEYYLLIKDPQDLKTITKEIKNGTINDFAHLERNLILMFCNALMYNETDSDVSLLTLEMMHECEEAIKTFKDYL